MNHSNRLHKTYPPYDQVEMLAKAFDPVVREAWLNIELPQMLANEAQAAALGMQIWPKHDGYVHPNENMITHIGNKNYSQYGKGRHYWEAENGYAVVNSGGAAYHTQAVNYHLGAAAQHQEAVAHHQQRAAYAP